MTAPNLTSERLLLEPVGIKHLSQDYVDWLNDAEVNAYLELDSNGAMYTIDKLRSYLEEVEKKQILFWAIILKKEARHIGNIKIDPLNRKHGFAEYGIMIGDKKQWGKGFSKEASELVIQYCFNVVGLRKIMLGVVSKNINAIRLYEKLGFVTEGLYRDHFRLPEGGFSDALRMSLFNPVTND